MMFVIVSLFQIRFWYQTSTLLYLGFFILLLGVKYFGLTSSGSQRWLNFYFMNLQPSELMKFGLFLFLAKYFSDFPVKRNSFIYYIIPFVGVLIPTFLVMNQPDLGTGFMIFLLGISLIFVVGLPWKVVFSIFIYCTILEVSKPFVQNLVRHICYYLL